MNSRIEIFKNQLSNLTSFSEKTSKKDYWNFLSSLVILFFLLVFFIVIIHSAGVTFITVSDLLDVYPLAFAAVIIPSTIRRLNDCNKSPYLVLLLLFVGIGWVILFVILRQESFIPLNVSISQPQSGSTLPSNSFFIVPQGSFNSSYKFKIYDETKSEWAECYDAEDTSTSKKIIRLSTLGKTLESKIFIRSYLTNQIYTLNKSSGGSFSAEGVLLDSEETVHIKLKSHGASGVEFSIVDNAGKSLFNVYSDFMSLHKYSVRTTENPQEIAIIKLMQNFKSDAIDTNSAIKIDCVKVNSEEVKIYMIALALFIATIKNTISY